MPHAELWLTSLSSALLPAGMGPEKEPAYDGMEEDLMLNHCRRGGGSEAGPTDADGMMGDVTDGRGACCC